MMLLNKRFLFLLAAILLTIGLFGCQLAKEDGLEVQSDKLIGIFITTEHLDLFDYDSYFQDNISSIMKNKSNVEMEYSEKYAGRIYAELKTMTYGDEEEGEASEVLEYVFEELEGIPFYNATVTHPDYEPYSITTSGNYVSDAHMVVGDDSSIEGTIYVIPQIDNIYYINPVYQSSNGQVFLTAGSGIHLSGAQSEGVAVTQTLEEKHTLTENGERTEKKFKVTVKIAIKPSPISVNLAQMDAENRMVSSQEYKPDAVPENIAPTKETAYIIVEVRHNSSSGVVTQRELLDADNAYFTNYFPTDEGFLQVQSTTLLWDE